MNKSDKGIRLILVQELESAGAKVTGTSVLCPFHDDNSPSGSIYLRKKDNTWAFHCHGCGFDGDVFDVRAKIKPRERVSRSGGSPGTDFQKKSKGGAVPAKIEASGKRLSPVNPPGKRLTLEEIYRLTGEGTKTAYPYRDIQGKSLMLALRIDKPAGGKEFKQFHAVGEGWAWGAPPKPWPLYDQPRLAETPNSPVIVTEGEKAAHSILDLGFVATTSPGGSGNGANADWSLLAGRQVILWPDHDEPGYKYLRIVREKLEGLQPAPELFWIDPVTLHLREGDDAYDYLERNSWTPECEDESENRVNALRTAFLKAKPFDGLDAFEVRRKATREGIRKTISWPWQEISRLSRALLPGTITIICGTPGAGKSFFLLQAFRYWLDNGIKACLFELEEDKEYHLQRAFAQLAGRCELTNDDWIRNNKEIEERLYNENKNALIKLGSQITDRKGFSDKLMDIAKWIEGKSKSGYRIICVDPISVASKSEKSWQDDREFVREVSRIASEYQCSIVLVAHPRIGMKRPSLDDLAGGASYQRLSQTVFLIVKETKPKPVKIKGEQEEQTINRRLLIAKARNGEGQDYQIGLYFHGLTFKERGVLV